MPASACLLQARSHRACMQELVKPDNQLQLTDAELAEEVAKMLVTTHPDLPRAGVRYALRERAWKPEPATELTMMHYQADGWLVNRATDEGARLAKAAHELASSAPSAEVCLRWSGVRAGCGDLRWGQLEDCEHAWLHGS